MSRKKIQILPLSKPVIAEKIKQFSSIPQLLFHLEVLRGEVLVSDTSDVEKKRISKYIDSLKSNFLNIETATYQPKQYKTNENLAFNFPGFIGNNPTIRDMIKDSAKWAKTPYPVFITGETGTGKEMFARLVHHISGKKTFLPVNCGAIPSSLIESELFGHTKGAFTGAHKARAGKFEEANGGTIFLDEIGELDEYIQVKLLRVIQFGEIQRLGSDKIIKVNPRIIAATNKNIKEQLSNGKLRVDLYYRLACCELHIPPLRERRDEILDLLNHFMLKSSDEINKEIPKLSTDIKRFLLDEYTYPGNIRELENIARRLVVLGNDKNLKDKIITKNLSKPIPLKLTDKIKDLTENSIRNILEKHKGSVQISARDFGISESRFYQLCRKFKIKPADYQLKRK